MPEMTVCASHGLATVRLTGRGRVRNSRIMGINCALPTVRARLRGNEYGVDMCPISVKASG